MVQPSPWHRRLRRLLVLVGTVSSFYLLLTFLLERFRQARIVLAREKRKRDQIKSHFNTLTSTISFTVYALLPTLQPQLFDAYPVEATSQALQSLSISSSRASVDPTPDNTPSDSLLLPTRDSAAETSSIASSDAITESAAGVGESWASEFQHATRGADAFSSLHTDAPSITSSSFNHAEMDDTMSSVMSQSISLPATDVSSDSNSPPFSGRALHSSPPNPDNASDDQIIKSRSRKELWKDLKIQTLSRALTTIYLLPMLQLLTSSQLAILARSRFLRDLQSSLPNGSRSRSRNEGGIRGMAEVIMSRTGWLNYFSVDEMGLGEVADEGSSSCLPDFSTLIPATPARLVSSILSPLRSVFSSSTHSSNLADVDSGRQEDDEEAERLFLTYSWWLLHEGWKSVAHRVDFAVERVFSKIHLKHELSLGDWENALQETRQLIDGMVGDAAGKPHDFSNDILPISPSRDLPPSCPIPQNPEFSQPLLVLLKETQSHISSLDGQHLLQRGVSALSGKLLEELSNACFAAESTADAINRKRRLVDCLPEIGRWCKSVWEGVPDGGVEALLALSEYESFTALIFGDWASGI